jgi:hypothetical protein
VRDIVACRTSRMGGHLEVCSEGCGFIRPAYNSCRNRHCPKCQILKQELWAEAQESLLLPCLYFQIVFTIPGELHPLFRTSPAACLDLLFAAVSETLTEVARPRLKAAIGFTAVLHTWTQQLRFHPHIHCIVPAGGLSIDGDRWIATRKTFFLPVKVLRLVFRAKLLSKLENALAQGDLRGAHGDAVQYLKRAARKTWVVYARRPLAGPRHVVRYLSRYVHRIAIANSRIVGYDGRVVTFRYKARAEGGITKDMTLPGPHFAQRFLQHVLPARFVRIRHYGLLSARRRKDLVRCRELLKAGATPKRLKDANWVDAFVRIFGRNPLECPKCKIGTLHVRDVLPPMRP